LKKKTSARGGTKKFEMVFVSDPKLIAGVEQFLGQINKIANLDDGTFYRLLVAATEAVNNAILHGNKSDVSKHVFITCLFRKNDSLTLRVEDQGGGFDPMDIPNPIEEQNLLKTSGRGVFLMRELMDEVNFTFGKQGSVVELVVNLRRLK
jgi:serine/threonine-protein kinase RsbW